MNKGWTPQGRRLAVKTSSISKQDAPIWGQMTKGISRGDKLKKVFLSLGKYEPDFVTVGNENCIKTSMVNAF